MFFCCCPRKTKQQQLNQSLIETDQIPNYTKTASQSQGNINKSETTSESKLSLGKVNTQSAKDENDKEKYENGHAENKSKPEAKTQSQTHIGVAPSFGKTQNIKKPFNSKDYQKNIVFSKKSHLWNQQLRSDLIYFSLKNGAYIYMSYRLTKNQEIKGCPNALDYFLSKSQERIHVIVGKQSMINGKLPTLSKYNHNLITAVYGSSTSLEQNIGTIESIMVEDLRSIRWKVVDSLVLMTDGLHNYQQLKSYFNTVLKDLSWDQLKKATFLLPVFMTLQNISQLLFSCMKQYVMNTTLEKASLDLAFDMELIECSNLDSYIIIKSRTQDVKIINSVYDHLKTSIAMFGKDLCDQTQKIYRDFYIRIRQKTLKEYFEMKELYKRNPSQFRAKVIQVRDIDPNVFLSLQNCPSLKQFPCQNSGFYYVIQNRVRQEIGRIFNIAQLQKKQVDTPVKSEWDDNATADDFKTVKTNKLDSVAKEELDKIDLDMGLCQDEDDQFYYKSKSPQESEMVIKMEETDMKIEKKNQNQSDEPIQKKQTKPNSQFSRNRCDKNHRYDHFY